MVNEVNSQAVKENKMELTEATRKSIERKSKNSTTRKQREAQHQLKINKIIANRKSGPVTTTALLDSIERYLENN